MPPTGRSDRLHLRRTTAVTLALCLVASASSGCDRGAPSTIDSLRDQARALTVTDRGAARRLYVRVRHDATGAGDHDALVEASLFFAGGDPTWIDVLDAPARADAYVRLRDVESRSSTATAVYGVSGGAFIGSLGCAIAGITVGGNGLGEPSTVWALIGVSIGLGAVGLGSLIAAIVLDLDSAAHRQRWVESLAPQSVTWSIGPGGAQVALRW